MYNYILTINKLIYCFQFMTQTSNIQANYIQIIIVEITVINVVYMSYVDLLHVLIYDDDVVATETDSLAFRRSSSQRILTIADVGVFFSNTHS